MAVIARVIGVLVAAYVAAAVAYGISQGYTFEQWKWIDGVVIGLGGGLGVALMVTYEDTHLPGWVTALAVGAPIVFLLGGPFNVFYLPASIWLILDIVTIGCYGVVAVVLVYPQPFLVPEVVYGAPPPLDPAVVRTAELVSAGGAAVAEFPFTTRGHNAIEVHCIGDLWGRPPADGADIQRVKAILIPNLADFYRREVTVKLVSLGKHPEPIGSGKLMFEVGASYRPMTERLAAHGKVLTCDASIEWIQFPESGYNNVFLHLGSAARLSQKLDRLSEREKAEGDTR